MSGEVPSLVEQILSGTNTELTRMAARGILPLPPEDLIRVLLGLIRREGGDLAAMATVSLGGLDPRQVVRFVDDVASVEDLETLALRGGQAMVTEAILRRRDVGHDLLLRLAPRLTPELQEVLLLRQDVIVDRPDLLDALEINTHLSNYSRRRISEYRRHLIPSSSSNKAEPEEPEEEEELLEGEANRKEVEAAMLAAREKPAEGEVDETTGLSDAQVRTMPVPVRLRLARGAGRSLRALLIRDPNSRVAVAVLQGNPVSDSEIELFAGSRTVVQDVLEEISRRQEWTRKYSIVSNLVHNPRTPVGIAMRFLPRMSVRELKNLSRDRNVADAVRTTAARLYRMKHS